jgi:general secretion pathway protein A
MNQANTRVVDTRAGTHPLTTEPGRVLIRVSCDGNLKIPVEKEVLTIGRRSTNDICMRSRFISRYHARIINTPAGAIIEDLNSSNGIAVNAQRVRRRQPLRSGDVITIGPLQLRYFDLHDSTSGYGHA